MSDTQEDTIEEPETDPNFSVERIEVNFNGKQAPGTKFTWGAPKHTVITRDLTLGDEFSLIGVAGDLSNNQKWMILAGLAWSAYSIDDVPVIQPKQVAGIAAILDRIGTEGLSAYIKAAGKIAKQGDPADLPAAAKN